MCVIVVPFPLIDVLFFLCPSTTSSPSSTATLPAPPLVYRYPSCSSPPLPLPFLLLPSSTAILPAPPLFYRYPSCPSPLLPLPHSTPPSPVPPLLCHPLLPSPPLPLPLQVILVLKKELSNTESAEDSETVDVSGYRQLLVQTLHQCSVKFSSVAPSVVPVVSGRGGGGECT